RWGRRSDVLLLGPRDTAEVVGQDVVVTRRKTVGLRLQNLLSFLRRQIGPVPAVVAGSPQLVLPARPPHQRRLLRRPIDPLPRLTGTASLTFQLLNQQTQPMKNSRLCDICR